ncbi:MAG: serine hydroxymethyltransferase [Planctomycetota bacterium]|nr:serine hydroxymethyltransferase [Planctomycetota bacterium]
MSGLKPLADNDPAIYMAVMGELARQRTQIELIASENVVSRAVLAAAGSVLTNKYAEGYPGARYYSGCEDVDDIENLAIQRCKRLFKAEYANVQPHSGTQANMAIMFASLEWGSKILAMQLDHGGHLSHGHPLNFSGKKYDVVSYGVSRETEMIDMEDVRSLAHEHKPKMIIAGASSYSREIDFAAFREVADEVGALLLVDMAHISGLVATGAHPTPVPYADFVSSSTHKTLRGPRSGFILAKKEHGKSMNRGVFPGIQGGPLMHIIAAKAVAFRECMTQEFKDYIRQVLTNAKALSQEMAERGYRIVSGGTDNHQFSVDVTAKNLTGRDASNLLESVGITVNKNLIPFDEKPPQIASGLRLGTPAITSRGMKEAEMAVIADMIDRVLSNPTKTRSHLLIRAEVAELCAKFPLYQNIEVQQ